MSPAPVADELTRALRILQDESRDGCHDQVVMGGLAGYALGLSHRLGMAADDPALRPVRRLLADYGTLSSDERRQRIEQLTRHIGGLLAEQAIPPARAARTMPTPSNARPAPPAPPRAAAVVLPTVIAAPVALPDLPPPAGVDLSTPLSALKGIGPSRARLFARLELHTVRDLLFHFPTRHQVFAPVMPIADLFFQTEASVVGILDRLDVEPLQRGLKRIRGLVRDQTGTVPAVWLRHGYANLGVRPSEPIALSGKLVQTGRQLSFDNPEYERADGPAVHTRTLVPVYPSTAGLSDRELRNRVHWAVTRFARQIPDPLPDDVRRTHGLLPIGDALRHLHFPTSAEEYEQARQRFAFEELFSMQVVVLQRRAEMQADQAPVLARREAVLDALGDALPFRLTVAQSRVVDEILEDTAGDRPMVRLVQGEVGSGKTAVAALALLNAAANGYQAALLAPTEILAEQHFATLTALYGAAEERLVAALGHAPVVRLLTGSVTKKQRQSVYAEVAGGGVDVLVGTQALIQESVSFARLGLVVVDEQHRFGARQRIILGERARSASALAPHLLVMTATPIPRTLALSQFGDLDLSLLDELPPGRHPIRTLLLSADERDIAYERVRREVDRGRQAFIICPLVEESDALQVRAATEEFQRLSAEDLAGLRLGLLHGRMKSADKDAVMHAFRDQRLDVLVSTAVVEVGVDVPNATVMLIDGADRFGLAQLHQFRGRVGRGEHASVCLLLTDLPNPSSNERLRAVESSSDGLTLAEADLRLRGPGDYFGVRQSGFPLLRAARLDDLHLMEAARAAARALLAADPHLTTPEHALLAEHLTQVVSHSGGPS